jgi:hypothetical protein
MTDGLGAAQLLFADGDATAALVVCVEQEPDRAHAALVRPHAEVVGTL